MPALALPIEARKIGRGYFHLLRSRYDSRRFLYKQADVAQLVEQLTRNEQVVRSNRIIGSSLLPV